MLEFLSILHDTILQIASNSTTNIIPPDLPEQVGSNTTGVTATLTGLAVTAGGVLVTALRSRQNNTKVATKGSEIDKLLLNDVIDNYNDFREWLNIEKQIQDLSVLHPDYSFAKLLGLVYDVSTGETMGQRRAKYILKINEYYKSYYQNTNVKNIDDMGKNPLQSTLNLVRDKTTPS